MEIKIQHIKLAFVSALILKTSFPQYEVDVIRSTKIGTIGVGEGSTEHFTAFMVYVGISAGELVKETDAKLSKK